MSEVDWGRYNLPAIWSLISDVDVCTGSDRVLAWDGLASAMRDQHKRLLTAADSLAAVWPPEKNDSARFFMQQVNGLADSMQETLQKAENTKAGLQGVIQAFSTAQATVRELASGREGVSNDWMPRFVDHAEDKYDEHAQAAMREAESAIQDHGSQIQSPSLFRMDPLRDENGHHLTGDTGGSGAGSSSGNGTVGISASPRPVAVPMDPNSMIPPGSSAANGGALGTDNDVSGAGPVLSGIAPGLPPTAGIGGPSAGPVGGLPSTPPLGSGGGSGGLGVLPIGAGGLGSGTFGALPGGTRGARRPVSVRRGLPSGAVIGENSERGIAGERGATGAMPMGGGAGGRGRDRGEGTIDGEADQRWATYEGVVPVIKPDTTTVRHDPGPGVIGFDR